MDTHDTFDHLAAEIDRYARDLPATLKTDPDGDEFADGLGVFEARAMRTYEAYRRHGVEHFIRPRKSFATLRKYLAEKYPKAFDLPTVAKGTDAAPPYQWAIEDARACRLLATLAKDAKLPEAALSATDPTLLDADADLLRWLVARNVQMAATEIEKVSGSPFGTRKTVSVRLRRLHGVRLVIYPPESKLGALVTNAGREWVRKHPE